MLFIPSPKGSGKLASSNGATVAVTGFGVGRLVKVTPGSNGTVTITKPTSGVGIITGSTNKTAFDAAVAAGVGDATHIIAQSDNSVRNTIDEYIPTDKYSTVYDGIVADEAVGKAVAVYPIINKDDVKFFIETLVGKKDSIFLVSLPHSSLMLNAKWKVVSKQYQQIQSSPIAINRDNWMDRYSARGSEYFLKLRDEENLAIFRAELGELKKSFGLNTQFKERTPADCKFLQNTLKIKHL